MAVVHAHQVTVAGQPHIALDPVGALLQGELIGRAGCALDVQPMRRGVPPRTGGQPSVPSPEFT